MTHTLRVLFCLPHISRTGGGVSESARLQVLALQEGGGCEISVMSMDDAYFKEDRPYWGEVDVRAFRLYGPRSYAFSPSFLLALLRERPDVIHVHAVWQFHCAAVYIWSLITGRPYIVTPHGMLEPWIRARSPRLKWMVAKLYQDRFLKRAAGFQILTEKERSDVAEFLNGAEEEVIPNYVRPFRRDVKSPCWFQEEYQGKDVFLFLGRIHEKKGCAELCEAWDNLCKKNHSFAAKSVLVFCGWNDGLDGFEEKVAKLGASHGNAVFAGPQYGVEKARSLSAATFFVLPSKSEGLPMAILEAWSAGAAVIMTEDCNLPQGFEHSAAIRTGTDVHSIMVSLEAASNLSTSDRKNMTVNGKSLLEENFSATTVRGALLSLYHRAVRSRKA